MAGAVRDGQGEETSAEPVLGILMRFLGTIWFVAVRQQRRDGSELPENELRRQTSHGARVGVATQLKSVYPCRHEKGLVFSHADLVLKGNIAVASAKTGKPCLVMQALSYHLLPYVAMYKTNATGGPND